MFKKIKFFMVVFFLTVIFANMTYATTKEDIIGYVNSQSVCGDVGLFNTYKSTFTRLLRQKDLSEEQLSQIYGSLTASVGILNSKGVCRISDLSKLSESEKNSVMGNLSYGAGIITNAKNYTKEESEIPDDSKEKKPNYEGTKITINTETNTMDIYENGVLIDKVSIKNSKMTYTGVNTSHVLYVVLASFVIVLALIPYIALFKKHTAKTRFVKNILMSLIIVSVTIILIIVVFGRKIDYLTSMLKMVNFKTQNAEYKVELNDDKTIKKYPSYGAKYGNLSIPSLNINQNIYFGDTQTLLNLGIGHTTYSNMPTEGGSIIYSSHNRKNMLQNLKNIKIKDEIIVDTDYAKCTYIVKETKVLKDGQTDKLNNIDNKETLILYTCYPFDTYVYSDKRFVVYATIKEINWK